MPTVLFVKVLEELKAADALAQEESKRLDEVNTLLEKCC